MTLHEAWEREKLIYEELKKKMALFGPRHSGAIAPQEVSRWIYTLIPLLEKQVEELHKAYVRYERGATEEPKVVEPKPAAKQRDPVPVPPERSDPWSP